MKYTYKLLNVQLKGPDYLIRHQELEEQLNSAGQEGFRFVGKQVDWRGLVAIMEKEEPE